MNLDELRSVQSKERSKDSLQHLRESFYADVAAYIQELRDERTRIAAAVDNPFDSDDISRLSDEIETAEDVVEALYERRVGKVVKRASIAAAGMPVDEEGLTTEEQELYDDLVARIRTNKSHVLEILGGEIPAGNESETRGGEAPDPAAAPDSASRPAAGSDGAADAAAESPSGVSAADAMGAGGQSGNADADGATEPSPEPPADSPDPEADSDAERADVERRTVRITRDVGEILGVDERQYHLEREDVITLPAANADPLVERDAAERLD